MIRPPWLTVVGLVLTAVPVAYTAVCWDGLGPPVSFSVRGTNDTGVLPGDPAAKVFVKVRDEWESVPQDRGDAEWVHTGQWVRGIRIAIPKAEAARFEGLNVKFAEKEFGFSRESYAPFRDAAASDASVDVYEFPDHVRSATSAWSAFQGVRNWRSDGAVCLHLFARTAPFLGVVLFLIARRTRLSAWAFRFLTETAPARVSSPAWDVAGVVALVAAFAVLEYRQPFYFAQDDVMAAELPVIVYGMRSVWAGHWPEYNPLIYLGGPLASVGMFQFTYPPAYVAYAVARFGLGNEFLTAEVYAALHLLAGYGVTRLLAGRLGMARPAAVVTALTFVLAGSSIIIGRSWSGSLGNVVWLPLLMLALRQMTLGPVGWKWVLGTGLTVGMFFQQGFVQYAAFACGFFLAGAVYLAATRAVPVRRALLAIPVLVVGGGLTTPLLYNQMLLMSTTVRGYSGLGSITTHLAALVVPYPLVEFRHPLGWGNYDVDRFGHMFFAGGLLIPLCVVEGFLFVAGLSWDRRLWAGRVWLLLAVLAFVLTLGEDGGLWTIGSELPLIDSLFRYPFRVLPAFTLFSCLAGGLTLDRVFRASPRGVDVTVGALAVVVLGYHVWHLTTAMYTYPFRPFPPVSEEWKPVAEDAAEGRHRFLAQYIERSSRPDFGLVLPANLPMVYDLPAFDGYSPLNETNTFRGIRAKIQESDPPEAAELVRRYGIRWVADSRAKLPPVGRDTRPEATRNRAIFDLLRPQLKPVHLGGSVELFELPGADPLGFAVSHPERPLPVKFGGLGVDLDVGCVLPGDRVTANFLWYPTIRTYLDGVEVPCEKDEWHRIRVDLPRAGERLHVRCEPPWRKGLLIGAGLVLGGAVLALPLIGRSKQSSSPLPLGERGRG